jgi:hypothetical protein
MCVYILSRDRVTVDGFALIIGFIEHLYTQPVTTGNYNSLTVLHTVKITVTAAHMKSSVFASRFLVMDPNNVLSLRPYRLPNIPQLTKLNLSLMLRPTDNRPVYLGIKHPSGAYDQIFITARPLRFCYVGRSLSLSLSDERAGLSFTIAAGPRQSSHSEVRVSWDSRPYFTVSDSRLPFSSPPATRRTTVEVFDPASTRDC